MPPFIWEDGLQQQPQSPCQDQHNHRYERPTSGGINRQTKADFSQTEGIMNDDTFNMSVRKFLKKFGITAQREIENTIQEALAKGSLTGKEKLAAKVTLTLGQTGLNLVVEDDIELE
jgi:uncharacterized protein DUF6494